MRKFRHGVNIYYFSFKRWFSKCPQWYCKSRFCMGYAYGMRAPKLFYFHRHH
jgi:hypothetical protein